MTPTIDTAISAWKAATTDAERDAAAAAIEEHVAHDTPEGADYVAATDELLARLKAEFGPVPAKPARDGTTYSAEALRVLEGMAPPRRPAGHVEDRPGPERLALTPEERAAALEADASRDRDGHVANARHKIATA